MRGSSFLLPYLLLIGLWSGTETAVAGDCRARLRPLLLAAVSAPDDLLQVRALCTAEAEAGDAEATYQLALFSLGLTGNWQPEAAIPLIRSAADRGVTEAQYWLAWQSEAGPALPHDPGIARDWYEKAASGNHRLALQRLADAWDKGELGLPADPGQALELRARIRQCAEKGSGTRD